MATKRLKQDVLSSPEGNTLKVNWMPGERLRLDFVGFPAVITKIFPDPDGDTHVDISYKKERNRQ